jgi:DNA-directed RNA polymerase subunit RPC12/RpoP
LVSDEGTEEIAGTLGIFGAPPVAATARVVRQPTLVTTGIVLAVLRSREDARLLGVHGRCPRCGVEQDFPAGGRLQGQRALDCPRCHNRLTFAAAVVP